MRIRTLIVEHDEEARRKLRVQLEMDPDVEIAGECADGLEAVHAIESVRPQLVFLDVKMPGLDGFGILEAVESRFHSSAEFVLLSSRDDQAVRAFDAHAFDYILKPFVPNRILRAVERFRAVRSRLGEVRLEKKVALLLESLRTRRTYADWLLVRAMSNEKSVFLRVADIGWIEAARGDVILHVGKAAHTFRNSMHELEARLDPARFLRIHRSTIVNIEWISEVHPWFNGEQRIVLKNGTELTASASFAGQLKEFRHLGTRRAARAAEQPAEAPEAAPRAVPQTGGGRSGPSPQDSSPGPARESADRPTGPGLPWSSLSGTPGPGRP